MSEPSKKTDSDITIPQDEIKRVKAEMAKRKDKVAKFLPAEVKKAEERLRTLKECRARDLGLTGNIYTEEDLKNLDLSDPAQKSIWIMKQEYDRSESEVQPEINLKLGLIPAQEKLIKELHRKYIENT
jgi:hypothetical protein